MRVCNNTVFVGFKSGDTEMFMWDESNTLTNQDKEFYKLNCDKTDEHEDELSALDYLPHIKKSEDDEIITSHTAGLFVTGARDGLVKIWNIKKELIREIKFPEPITSVCFLNQNGDILVGHVGKVSSVLASDYKPYEVMDLAHPTEQEV